MACVASCAGHSAQALERITLRNGFTLDCSHHYVLGDKVRVFTGPGEANYQDLLLLQIAGIEALPEPITAPPIFVTTVIPEQPDPTAAQMRSLLERAGLEHNIDVELLASVLRTESASNLRAVSRAGARGLMQLMPSTARSLGVQDAFRADQNIAGGTAYLDSLLKRYNDNLALALAAYNAGPAAVARYRGIPPYRETRVYVARVMNEFYRRKHALSATQVASR